jgi:type VI protein secretion system component Hcp
MRRREERIGAEATPGRTDARPPADPARRVLALQRSIGNQAVGAMLARAPEATDTKAAAASVTLEGIGTIPVTNIQLGTAKYQHFGGGGGPMVRDSKVNVTSLVGDHSAGLTTAAASGKPFKTVVIDQKGSRITLTDATVSWYSLGRGPNGLPEESWTLEYGTIEYSAVRAEPGGG